MQDKGLMDLVMIQSSFVPDKKRTMAELTDEEKSEISHRGNAIQLLKAYLEGGQNE